MSSTPLKIVAIGAGSHSFGKGVVVEVLHTPAFNTRNCILALVDLDETALDGMYRFAQRVKEHLVSKVTITATTDRTAVLPQANYVITSVAIKRYLLWEQDFRIPLAYGFQHVLGENGGPGALFHTLRNFELIIPICRDMERLCPEARLLNFTNPESRVVRVVTEMTKIRAVGLCHGAWMARTGIAAILQKPIQELDIVSGGLNHFFWVTKIADKQTGEDLYPEVRRRAHDPNCPEMPPLVKMLLDVFGLYTIPSDDHVGEYLSYAAEFTGTKWPYGSESHAIPRDDPSLHQSRLEQDASGELPLEEEMFCDDHTELAVPIIRSLELNQRLWVDSVNVPNIEGYVEGLPRDTVVEVPAWVDGSGIHPIKIDPLPEALAAYCRTQASIQHLLAQAYQERSRNLLLQALLIDPVVNSYTKAEQMLEEMLVLQKEYLPTFT